MVGGGAATSEFVWPSPAQIRRIEPYFHLSHGISRVDDRTVIRGIIFVIRNGLRWRDAPKDCGSHKPIDNRFIRWSRMGVFNTIFAALAGKDGKPDPLMIDAFLKAKSFPKPSHCSATRALMQTGSAGPSPSAA